MLRCDLGRVGCDSADEKVKGLSGCRREKATTGDERKKRPAIPDHAHRAESAGKEEAKGERRNAEEGKASRTVKIKASGPVCR